MNEDLGFLNKHRTAGAIIDANLLLVYVVGHTDRQLLSRHHHTKQYVEDFPLVQRVIEHFASIYTTPNILTEVSNLGGKDWGGKDWGGKDWGGKDWGGKVLLVLAALVRRLDEQYCPSGAACDDPAFHKLGLTDAGLCVLARDRLVVTTDFNLHLVLRHRGFDAINFNHLRQASW